MQWFYDLWTQDSVAHSVLLFALVIAVGVWLGKIKVFGISLGITFVLFVGILVGHLGFSVNHEVLHFVREFGLILFVYSVGMQVGPGFFSSFKKGGMTLNMLAISIVFLGVITTIIIHYATGIPMSMMVGILSGAVTNTPGLGAAQQTLEQLKAMNPSIEVPEIALGYAVAYPLGVLGIISSMLFIKTVFRVNLTKEQEKISSKSGSQIQKPFLMSMEVRNPAIYGKTINELGDLLEHKLVISRIAKKNIIAIPTSDTVLEEGDELFVVTSQKNVGAVKAFIGKEIEKDWDYLESQLVSRRILVSKSEVNGKKLSSLRLRSLYGINVTRVNRSGVDLFADPNLALQVGDRVTVVGTQNAISNVETFLGNSMKRLNEPNIIPIFVGIFLGILLGSVPFVFPGIPMPIKLGLAGGPLIVAILISNFGTKFSLVTYTTQSANLLLREVGITLFLAAVGLNAGKGFVETVVSGDGLLWVGLGVIITLVPLLIVGIVGKIIFKLDYFQLTGLLAGSTTDPPALAYANSIAGNDAPSVSYATVYPIVMFCRVLTAQLLILLFVS